VRILAVVLSVLGAAALGQLRLQAQAAPETLSLERAIDVALASNRPARISALSEAIAGSERDALSTQRKPKLDLKGFEGGFLSPLEFSFRQGSLGTYPATGPIPYGDITIDSPQNLVTGVLFTAVQPLTQLRKISQGEKLLDLGRNVAAEKTRGERRKLVADVKRAYYGLQQTRAGLVAVDEASAQLTELERVVASYVEREVALEGDRLAVQTEQARVTLQRVTLRNLEATLKERINVLLARPLSSPFDVAALPPADIPMPNLDTAVELAKRSRSEIREARLNVQRATEDIRLKGMERTPDVSLGFSYLRMFNVDVVPHNVAAAGVIVSWEPYDWGRKKYETDMKSKTLEQAQLGVEEADALIELDVRVKYRKVLETQQGLILRTAARATAAERLRVATERYRVEASLLKDVLEAQTAVAQTTQEYQQALGDFWTARAEFDEAVGDQP